MSSFLKTCISQIMLLVALAVPVFGVGCERQSDPPVEPRSQAPAPRAAATDTAVREVVTRLGVRGEDEAAQTTQG